MNHLPEHRRAIAGRTWRESWNAADMDPIQLPPPRRLERVADVIAACVVGLLLGLLAVHWFSI